MKLEMMGYEVDIKCKQKYKEDVKYNKKDTYLFLNDISSMLFELAEFYEKTGEKVYMDCAPYRKEEAVQIFKYLKSKGLYDKY